MLAYLLNRLMRLLGREDTTALTALELPLIDVEREEPAPHRSLNIESFLEEEGRQSTHFAEVCSPAIFFSLVTISSAGFAAFLGAWSINIVREDNHFDPSSTGEIALIGSTPLAIAAAFIQAMEKLCRPAIPSASQDFKISFLLGMLISLFSTPIGTTLLFYLGTPLLSSHEELHPISNREVLAMSENSLISVKDAYIASSLGTVEFALLASILGCLTYPPLTQETPQHLNVEDIAQALTAISQRQP